MDLGLAFIKILLATTDGKDGCVENGVGFLKCFGHFGTKKIKRRKMVTVCRFENIVKKWKGFVLEFMQMAIG